MPDGYTARHEVQVVREGALVVRRVVIGLMLVLMVTGAVMVALAPLIGIVLYARGSDLYFGLALYGFMLALVSGVAAVAILEES